MHYFGSGRAISGSSLALLYASHTAGSVVSYRQTQWAMTAAGRSVVKCFTRGCNAGFRHNPLAARLIYRHGGDS